MLLSAPRVIRVGWAMIDESLATVIWRVAGSSLPTSSLPLRVNRRFPAGPTTMLVGPLLPLGRGNSVTTPEVVIRPILLLSDSVNQRAPSFPSVIPSGNCPVFPLASIGNSLILPLVSIRPILPPNCSVNHSALSAGTDVMPQGAEPEVGVLNSVIVPEGVILPILLAVAELSVNQRFPSGPCTICWTNDRVVGSLNSVTVASNARDSRPSRRGLRLRRMDPSPVRRVAFHWSHSVRRDTTNRRFIGCYSTA